MDIFFFAAFVAPVVALVERNHRRHAGLPHVPAGAAVDRDLERIHHDLVAVGEATEHPRPRRTSTQPAPAVCRPAAS